MHGTREGRGVDHSVQIFVWKEEERSLMTWMLEKASLLLSFSIKYIDFKHIFKS